MNVTFPFCAAPGDAVSRRKGPVTHWGVVVAQNLVLDIVPGGTPRLISLWQFSDDQPLTVHTSSEEDRPAILRRAWQVQADPRMYDAFRNNCQHLKNFILTGERYSETLQEIGALTAIATLLMLAGRR